MERYRVTRRQGIVDRITDALILGGAQILRAPDHRWAPFEYDIKLPDGRRLELVCYAFLANQYRQEGRPSDEHRFQIKYGSEFDRYHDIFIDPDRGVVTLFLGVHLEQGIFVAVDPAMHNPTWFSRSVEFKLEHVTETLATGWFAWERERVHGGRRKISAPLLNNQTECLLGLVSEHFVRYVQFERVATGLDAGERMLLAEKMSPATRSDQHPLEDLFGLTAHEILDVIWGRFRLGVAVRGGVAEHHLEKFLRAVDGLNVRRLDEDGQPDFQVQLGSSSWLVECKNVLRTPAKGGIPKVDFQKTRASKGDPCSRFYSPDSFDVLAACLHPVTERWEFKFRHTRGLPAHKKCVGRFAPRVVVRGDEWQSDIRALLR